MKTLTVAFLVAAASILYELLFAKALTELIGDPILWESLAMGLFVTGMGLGAWRSNNQIVLGRIEMWLTLFGAAAVPVLHMLHILYRIYFYHGNFLPDDFWLISPKIVFGALALTFPLGLGALTGVELPLLLRRDHKTSHVLASYYFGTLFGSIAITWLTAFDVGLGMLFPAALSTLACILLRAESNVPRRHLVALLLVLISVAGFNPALTQLRLQNYYYNRYDFMLPPEGEAKFFPPIGPIGLPHFSKVAPIVERYYSRYQTIDIVPNYDRAGGSIAGEFNIYLDGRFQVSSAHEAGYHEGMAHIPLTVTNKIPKSVLVLGGGDGFLAKHLLKQSSIETIKLVDLDATILSLAKERWNDRNDNALNDAKVDVEVGDAFLFLREKPQTYDAIYVDFPYPYGFDSSRLYSLEMFMLIDRALKDDGMMVLNSPVDFHGEEPDAERSILLSTMHHGGFKHIVGYNAAGHHFAIAAKRPIALTFDKKAPDFSAIKPTDLKPEKFVTITDAPDVRIVNTLVKPQYLYRKDPFF